MRVHGVTRVLTFNEKDFRRYQNLITIVTPAALLTQRGANA